MMSMHSFEMTTYDQTKNFAASEDAVMTDGLYAAAEDVRKPWALEKNFNVAQALTDGAIAAFFEGRPQNLRAVLGTFTRKGFFKNDDFADGISYMLCNAITAPPSADTANTLAEMGKGAMHYTLNNMLLCYATRMVTADVSAQDKVKYTRVIDAVLETGVNCDYLNGQAIRTAFEARDRKLLKKFHDAGADFEIAAQSMEQQPKSFYDPGWIARKFLGAATVVIRDPASQAELLRDIDRLFTAEKTIETLKKGPSGKFRGAGGMG